MTFLKRKYYQILSKFYKKKSNKVEEYLKIQFYLKNNKKLSLDNPIEFAEKMQWLKLNYYNDEYKRFVDKYEVRSFIKEKIGDKYLVNLINVYDNVEDIDLEELPNRFVLKCTHGSGYNIIVKDLKNFNWVKAKRRLSKYMSSNYYDKYKEVIYKNIKPRIVAEEYLDQLDDEDIIDYKFLCFHGQPKFIHVKASEESKRKEAYYDINWNKIEVCGFNPSYLKRDIKKPDNLEELLSVSKKLSSDFPFVRVDLYSIENEIYFGELTFIHKGGMKRVISESHNKIMGDLIKLPIDSDV